MIDPTGCLPIFALVCDMSPIVSGEGTVKGILPKVHGAIELHSFFFFFLIQLNSRSGQSPHD